MTASMTPLVQLLSMAPITSANTSAVLLGTIAVLGGLAKYGLPAAGEAFSTVTKTPSPSAAYGHTTSARW